jgi:hypothetical protein
MYYYQYVIIAKCSDILENSEEQQEAPLALVFSCIANDKPVILFNLNMYIVQYFFNGI